MTITFKAKEVREIIDDLKSLVMNANAALYKVKELIVEPLSPVEVRAVFEGNDYVNNAITIYITCEVGEEGWITADIVKLPEYKAI